MLDKLTVQRRMVIATLLAIIFFIGYDYFYLSKFRPQVDINASSNQTIANQAPEVKTNTIVSETTAQAKVKSKIISEIKGKNFDIKIDEFGRFSSFALTESQYKQADGNQINLVDHSMSPLPLETRFSDQGLNKMAFEVPYTASASFVDAQNSKQELVLTQNLGNLVVVKKITFNPNGSYELIVNLSKSAEYFITPGARPNINVDGYTIHGSLVRKSGGKLEITKDGDLDAAQSFANSSIAAASDRYYTALFYNFDNKLDVVISPDSQKNIQVFAKSSGEFKTNGFMGPKEHKLLDSIDKRLIDVIEYGWFTFIAKPMFSFLNWLHGFTGNWGWAIVIMTLFIRLALFPLSYKGMMSMNKLKDLSPKIKELQAKYKGDSQKLQTSMMELYKKHGANPMGGCLPILLQIPVFFAIYRVLLNAIELKGAPWILWISDLAEKDPYYILPVAMGLLMFLQQRITPTTFTDPMQEKIMKYLPLVFTLFFITFPAGLTLYWTTNNISSFIQQVVINKMFKKHKQEAIAEKKHENRS